MRGGFEVLEAASARDALETVERQRPAAAVVDLKLADGMTGPGLAETLGQRGIPVVVTKGYAPAHLDGLERWPVLVKPFDPEALVAALRSAIGDGPATPAYRQASGTSPVGG